MSEGFQLFEAVDISGAFGVLVLGFILIATGRLVPKKYYDEAREDRDKFEEAWKKSTQANAELSKGFKDLTEIAKNTNYLVKSLLPPLEKEQ